MSSYQLITVTITATNGAGTSEPSNEVSGRTNETGMIMNILILFNYHNYSTAPGIVVIVDVATISNATSTVMWNPPIQPNGIITGYEVMYSAYEDDADIITIPVTSNINSFNITDLCKFYA